MHRRHHRFARTGAALVAPALAAGLLVPVGAASGAVPLARTTSGTAASTAPSYAGAPGVEVPTVAWEPCRRSSGLGGLECATVEVPLDYDRPAGPTTEIAMTRRLADDPERRIGSLFVNPGGPGGEARYFVDQAAGLLGPRVRARFDVVGIDPRGVGGSSELLCRVDGPTPALPTFPRGERQVRAEQAFDRRVGRDCAATGGPILDHMSTADTARDMDVVRAALGDDQLTYYGISYGTQLGSTYANLFPDRVRAVVLDSVLDPVAWTTGRGDSGRRVPMTYRLGSGLGAQEAMNTALRECDAAGAIRCPLADLPGTSGDAWRGLLGRLRRGPLAVGGDQVTYADVIGAALGSLYGRRYYRGLMRFVRTLSKIETGAGEDRARLVGSATRLAERLRRVAERELPMATGRDSFLTLASFSGVVCADSVNPGRRSAWPTFARIAERKAGGGFGQLWTWGSSPCPDWLGSGADAYRGPFSRTTDTGVLIAGNRYDPATDIHGARVLHGLMPGSRLLTVTGGFGHGAIGTSPCVTRTFADYLVGQALPATDTTCTPATELFPAR